MPPPPVVTVVHEGRGGHLEIGARRYAIELVGEGRFAVHLPARCPAAHRAAVEAFVVSEPEKWAIEDRRRSP